MRLTLIVDAPDLLVEGPALHVQSREVISTFWMNEHLDGIGDDSLQREVRESPVKDLASTRLASGITYALESVISQSSRGSAHLDDVGSVIFNIDLAYWPSEVGFAILFILGQRNVFIQPVS
ncbi:hypothetical protein A2707_01470 [Candidatus Saccharibacteria bacterium RIFCSPHIGHO2_01_FULL_45_15]|nr:MAG: hypothetical protein A2707_01470 [Candidatus Saccharibacteria bacterium RIFCSPHIGHO2_01_FULL_45_15]OGL27951.1 MAG: hypothetical protein A3C39_02570 [Candidatus Saccharibacteria bacterium RIFCSPHIGHO2_02_FULL_46_12]OGL32860.1 MAG: hypothetical protein A3E76_05850 [Candidatus Saccharibacteria bacterium RIFCSPHIGHO2_12_FULL_44_22]